MVAEDRLSNLPNSVLIDILSLLPNPKQVVKTSLLSKQWRFLWKSVPVSSLYYTTADIGNYRPDQAMNEFVTYINRELRNWRHCHKIRRFTVEFRYEKRFAEDVDQWVHFATQSSNVEAFTLYLNYVTRSKYDFPQFAYENRSLTDLVLRKCVLNPVGSVSWSSLISLSIGDMNLTDGVMEKVLSGCPMLECLTIDFFRGINRLEISSPKLRQLIISDCRRGNATDVLEIFAPYIQNFRVLGYGEEIPLRLINVASLVSVVLDFRQRLDFNLDDDEDGVDGLEKECRYIMELLESLAHVENLKLGHWCIEFLSILELKGLQSPLSSRKCLTIGTALEHMDSPGIYRLLQSSPDLETLVIDWYNRYRRKLLSTFTNEDEINRMFETHISNCSLLHLKTIKIIHLNGRLSANKFVLPLVKYLLNNAKVLERIVITVSLNNKFNSVVLRDFAKMEKEFLSFPRSSPHAEVCFSYQ